MKDRLFMQISLLFRPKGHVRCPATHSPVHKTSVKSYQFFDFKAQSIEKLKILSIYSNGCQPIGQSTQGVNADIQNGMALAVL
jgi:hypothetical protein